MIRIDGVAARVFPSAVRSAETRVPLGTQGLYAEEIADLAGAHPRRLRDFSNGRRCARVALGALGVPPQALLREADGSTRWPPGVLGSISHTEGYCVAAVARRSRVGMVGVDVERVGAVGMNIWPYVFLPDEVRFLEREPSNRRACASTILFCAKEAYFKALSGRLASLRFREMHVTLVPNGRFLVRRVGEGGKDAEGRFIVAEGVVVAGVSEGVAVPQGTGSSE